MQILPSALKHGVSAEDALYAAEHYVLAFDVGDDPAREMRLGFDRSGRLREIVVMSAPIGPVIIHAMRARTTYRRLLEQGRGDN